MARPCFKIEKAFPEPLAGVDEAGCAPLAGPVVAAAVVLDRNRFPRGIDDSKVVPVKEREAICARLHKVARVGVGIATIPFFFGALLVGARLHGLASEQTYRRVTFALIVLSALLALPVL